MTGKDVLVKLVNLDGGCCAEGHEGRDECLLIIGCLVGVHKGKLDLSTFSVMFDWIKRSYTHTILDVLVGE